MLKKKTADGYYHCESSVTFGELTFWYDRRERSPLTCTFAFFKSFKLLVNMRSLSTQKRLVKERGPKRRARLVKADRKVTVMQIATHWYGYLWYAEEHL